MPTPTDMEFQEHFKKWVTEMPKGVKGNTKKPKASQSKENIENGKRGINDVSDESEDEESNQKKKQKENHYENEIKRDRIPTLIVVDAKEYQENNVKFQEACKKCFGETKEVNCYFTPKGNMLIIAKSIEIYNKIKDKKFDGKEIALTIKKSFQKPTKRFL